MQLIPMIFLLWGAGRTSCGSGSDEREGHVNVLVYSLSGTWVPQDERTQAKVCCKHAPHRTKFKEHLIVSFQSELWSGQQHISTNLICGMSKMGFKSIIPLLFGKSDDRIE